MNLQDQEKVLALPVAAIAPHLPPHCAAVRIVNTLEEAGIATIGDLLSRRRPELLAISNFGKVALQQVLSALAMMGFGAPGESTSPHAQLEALRLRLLRYKFQDFGTWNDEPFDGAPPRR